MIRITQVNILTYTQLVELDLATKHPLYDSFNNCQVLSVLSSISR